MKTIKVINFKGDAYEGDWNEKVYSSYPTSKIVKMSDDYCKVN